VTYVTVEDSNDEWVTFAAAAAFTGVMIAWGCAVWGTGYYHPPYWGWYGPYPYYYPHYPTYGYGASYNPWTGAYGAASWRTAPTAAPASAPATTRGPGRMPAAGGLRALRRPRRGAGLQPRTGTYAQTRQGANAYGSWAPRGCSA